MREVPRPRFGWLDIIRAMAVLLVLWDHFVGQATEWLKVAFYPAQFIKLKVFEPLAITQSGGFLGVCLFFLISGYIIAGVSAREDMRTFAIRRFLRIFPPLIVATVTSIAMRSWLASEPLTATAADILRNFFLVNYFHHPQVILVGVAWSLVIEVTFYLLVLVTLPLLHRQHLSIYLPFTLLVLSVLFVHFNAAFGPGFQAFAVSFLYIPILSIGVTFALLERGALSVRTFMIHGALAAGVFMYATWRIYPQFLQPADSYPVSALMATVIFGITWANRSRIRPIRALTLVAVTSYSLYLFHDVVGWTVLRTTYQSDPGAGFLSALTIAVAATTVAVVIVYNLVERPSSLAVSLVEG
ncbi:MAG: acyltransferase [Actinobacteria bacterium]|nr:acyltransferase [Actinomycetota bacterium]